MSYVNTQRAAELLRVTPETVLRWRKDGKLRADASAGRRPRRYLLSDVEQLIASRRRRGGAAGGAVASYPERAEAGSFHPFVQNIADFHAQLPPNSRFNGLLGPNFFSLIVPPAFRERAYSIADKLLRYAIERGHQVVMGNTIDIVVHGAAFEPVVRAVPYDDDPGPRVLTLSFKIEKRTVKTWRDRERRPVEDFIPQAIQTLERLAPATVPLQQERHRKALEESEAREVREQLRQRRADRVKLMRSLARDLNEATLIRALVAHLDLPGAPPRVRQFCEDALAMADRLMIAATPSALEARLRRLDLYDKARNDETPRR